MLSSSLMSSGMKLTRLYSSSSCATAALRRRKRGPSDASRLRAPEYHRKWAAGKQGSSSKVSRRCLGGAHTHTHL